MQKRVLKIANFSFKVNHKSVTLNWQWNATSYKTDMYSMIIFLIPGRCPDDMFTCASGECVTKPNPVCDSVSDCADESDEAYCCKYILPLQHQYIFTLSGQANMKKNKKTPSCSSS